MLVIDVETAVRNVIKLFSPLLAVYSEGKRKDLDAYSAASRCGYSYVSTSHRLPFDCNWTTLRQ